MSLELIDWENPSHKPFRILNFWASEVYYFHSTEQMIMTSKLCPEIQDMLFMFEVDNKIAFQEADYQI